VLTGVVAAFLAKGVAARSAAAAGAIACDAAAGFGPERGLIASDVASLLPLALARSDTGQSPLSHPKTRENRGDGAV
jgi:NAD(P)H-hydrate repair Nnr-like enzyme with NAD(P)H-hydrate dehydratase domain